MKNARLDYQTLQKVLQLINKIKSFLDVDRRCVAVTPTPSTNPITAPSSYPSISTSTSTCRCHLRHSTSTSTSTSTSNNTNTSTSTNTRTRITTSNQHQQHSSTYIQPNASFYKKLGVPTRFYWTVGALSKATIYCWANLMLLLFQLG